MHLADWMERVDLRNEMQEVYLHTFIFKLAIKLVAIFIPFYILESGFGLQSVFVFFLIYYGMYLPASGINALITSRIGYKHSMLLASLPTLAFYLFLRNVQTLPELYALAALGGYSFNLYWTGMNPETANSSRDGEREKEAGIFFSMPSLASIMAPFIGGLILSVFSFEALFGTTSFLVGISFLPFLLTDEHYTGMDLNFREFREEYSLTDFLTFTFEGVNSMGKKMLWPAYLAVIIGGSLNIGGAGSLRAVGSAVTSILIGYLADEETNPRIVLTGMSIAALTYLLMASVTTPLTAFALSLVNGLSYTAAKVPIYGLAMEHAAEEDLIEYFAVREVALSIGRVSVVLFTISVFNVMEGELRFLTAFSAVALSVLATGYFGSKM